MKIKEITDQMRRDFTAVLVCEHCDAEQKLRNGYDDAHYHQNVIPKIKCDACGETAPDSYRALTTRHPEGQVL